MGADRQPRRLQPGKSMRWHGRRYAGTGGRQAEAVCGRRCRSVLLWRVIRLAARRRDALAGTVHHRGDATFHVEPRGGQIMKNTIWQAYDPEFTRRTLLQLAALAPLAGTARAAGQEFAGKSVTFASWGG